MLKNFHADGVVVAEGGFKGSFGATHPRGAASPAQPGRRRDHGATALFLDRWPWKDSRCACKVPGTSVGAALLKPVVAQPARPEGSF